MKLFLAIAFSMVAMGGSEKELSNSDRTLCVLEQTGQYATGFSRCYLNDVMIGITSLQPLQIRCARMEVLCRGVDAKTSNTAILPEDERR